MACERRALSARKKKLLFDIQRLSMFLNCVAFLLCHVRRLTFRPVDSLFFSASREADVILLWWGFHVKFHAVETRKKGISTVHESDQPKINRMS